MLLKVINTELQFVFFDSVWATEARPTCRVNEIKHLRDNYMKCGLALVLLMLSEKCSFKLFMQLKSKESHTAPQEKFVD